jgi:uncharacterized protein YgiB involved in biofilm formation
MKNIIGQKLYQAYSWSMDGSIYRLFGALALAVGLIASPLIYITHHNAEKLNDRIEYLDSTPTVVFNSVAHCVSQGYSASDAQESYNEAKDIAGNMGTTLSYDNEDECADIHPNYEENKTPIYTTTMVGKTPIQTLVGYSTSYHPPMVAWQAVAHDISEAVPLYETHDEDTLMRKDGQTFLRPRP